MRPRDTDPEAWRVQIACWRRMGAERRAALALAMSDDARAIALAGIRSRRPELGPDAALRELLLRVYGRELVDAAWPPAGTPTA